MRSHKQQFFLLLSIFLGITSCSAQKAISHDISSGLSTTGAGSQSLPPESSIAQVSNDDVTRLQVDHGAGIISRETASPVLELERGEVDSSAQTDELPADSTGSTSPGSETAEMPLDAAETTASQAEPAADDRIERIPESTPVSQPVSATPAQSDDAPWSELQMQSQVSQKASKKLKKASNKSRKSKAQHDSPPPQIETAPKRAIQPVPAPAASQKAQSEEAILGRLVRELEFGTLANSITLLNQLISKRPEDPDYRSLLAMAIRLRDGDVWYDYSRKVANKEEIKETKSQPPVQIIKPTENETVNELKKSSWFLIRSVKR